MIGYKIVSIQNCFGTPYYASYSMYGGSRVFYEVGKEAKPHPGCGPLAVFSTLELACSFSGARCYQAFGDLFAIWKCEYTPSKEISVWSHHSEKWNLPEGTVLADSVILLERVL